MYLLKRYGLTFLLAMLINIFAFATAKAQLYSFEFYNDTFNIALDSSISIPQKFGLNTESIANVYDKLEKGNYQPIIDSLISYKRKKQLNDWLFYQLIRKTAETISPKNQNFERYTLYKWFFLGKSGYDTRLVITDNRIIMYVYNDENIFDIPYVMMGDKKYMCLNYHDYAHTNFTSMPDTEMIGIADSKKAFSYQITKMPEFDPKNYSERKLAFRYGMKDYHFDLKVSPEVEKIFKNYPGVDFKYYFNIPMTKETYGSLIPLLKKNISNLSQKNGVDYLMRFTRNSFLYENDIENFGKEKRLSPEQTLLNEHSDCDDRAALFFYLVKEIYDLPMIVLLYPTHVTMAVQFNKPVGKTISYNNRDYTVCEPTPQIKDLPIGKLPPKLKRAAYEIVYAYEPENKKGVL
ncbi:hypothetical protein SAMN06297358_2269 [Pedobacter xixiisoli]|uniref:Transglutaminase-like superfamily protein n=2 Tax=Pedobacter xixiisoli TaxID=1476464 RepID=A0A286A048_9SPHI|nr:hypothetical protein SAMN06297358_2269 [Pedobacter xixiisoli]